MTNAVLFIGWSGPVRGREEQAMQVWADAVAYFQGAQDVGDIASYEALMLPPHGGGLGGFFLVRGDEQQLANLQRRDEYDLLMTRVMMAVENLSVLPAMTQAEITQSLSKYKEQMAAIA